jgi:molecular chaperone GrpE
MMPKEPEEKEELNKESVESPESAPPEELPEATPGIDEALAAEKKLAEEYLASWQRAQADFINYKRRVEQERLDFNSYANANLCNSILPVVDDLERAIAHIPEEYAKTDWVEGVRLVEKKFKTVLEGQGVKPICALGMAFDPNLHEAIKHEKGKEGMIIAEYQKGYMINDKLLRPSRVGVGSGEEEKHHKAHTKETIKEEVKEGFDKTHPKDNKEEEKNG